MLKLIERQRLESGWVDIFSDGREIVHAADGTVSKMTLPPEVAARMGATSKRPPDDPLKKIVKLQAELEEQIKNLVSFEQTDTTMTDKMVVHVRMDVDLAEKIRAMATRTGYEDGRGVGISRWIREVVEEYLASA